MLLSHECLYWALVGKLASLNQPFCSAVYSLWVVLPARRKLLHRRA